MDTCEQNLTEVQYYAKTED